MGPSLYEDAMAPIYDEAVWRERNFYKADGEDKSNSPPPGSDTASRTPVQPSLLTTITSPVKDFSAWLTPNGALSWPRALIVVGGLVLIGYLVGKR